MARRFSPVRLDVCGRRKKSWVRSPPWSFLFFVLLPLEGRSSGRQAAPAGAPGQSRAQRADCKALAWTTLDGRTQVGTAVGMAMSATRASMTFDMRSVERSDCHLAYGGQLSDRSAINQAPLDNEEELEEPLPLTALLCSTLESPPGKTNGEAQECAAEHPARVARPRTVEHAFDRRGSL